MELTYRLEIGGPLPRVAQDQLRERFGDVRVQSYGDRTLVSGLCADQAALRAMLSLLWDVGVEVRVVEATPLSGRDGKEVRS
jgi:hypothetical protein